MLNSPVCPGGRGPGFQLTDALLGVLAVLEVPAFTNWPRFRILRPQGLHTRSENTCESCIKSNPTCLQILPRTMPKQSLRFEGLKRFSDDEWLCLPATFPYLTLKEMLQSLQLSLGRFSDISTSSREYDKI